MLDKGQGPEDIVADLQRFRETLQTHVRTLVGELTKLDKMNDTAVGATCAQIDLLIRDYTTFLMGVNATRVAHEAQAQNHEDLVGIRRDWGVVSTRTSMLRVELNQWTMMKPLVQAQVAERRKRVPLYEKARSKTALIQHDASDDVFNWLHKLLNPQEQSEDAFDSGCFADIGLPNSKFHQHLHAAYRVLLARGHEQPMRFLDVGCGGGLKVLTALRYFQYAHGLDYQQSYVDTAQALLRCCDIYSSSAFQADALSFDGYHEYDVIYFYRPMRDDEKLVALEKRIIDCAKPGTLLVAPYVGFGERYRELGCGRVDGQLYMSKTSQRQADMWRRKAEKTGVAVVHDEEDRAVNLWSPLLSASRRCGYDVTRYEALI